MTTSEEILRVAGDIEQVLLSNDYAIPNAQAVNRLKFLAGQLGAHDRYSADKAYAIASKAETFYSSRKHLNYPGGSHQLYVDMKTDLLGRIRAQADFYKLRGD